MQSIENLARIHGEIISRASHPTLPAYELLSVRLERADAVEGKANLAAPLVGTVVNVAIRRELAGVAQAGGSIRCRVRRTPDGVICESNPAPGDLEIG